MGHKAIRSRAVLPGGHPIHPILIPFPIAFLVGALATDAVSFVSDAAFWPDASRWLLAAGLVSGVVTAIPGLVDYFFARGVKEHRAATWHALGNGAVLALAAVNLAPRLSSPESFISPWGIVLSAVIASLLGITGYLGGELSYRHGIGMFSDDDADNTTSPASHRSA